jgi:hypothetical protein
VAIDNIFAGAIKRFANHKKLKTIIKNTTTKNAPGR